jgi:alkylation response protein AidB-like acyl-CoA dehydrogenase
LGDRLSEFMATHIYPNERRFYQEVERLGPWSEFPIVEELKPLARDAGLWNLFLPEAEPGGLSNLDYSPLCEIMGRSHHRQSRYSSQHHLDAVALTCPRTRSRTSGNICEPTGFPTGSSRPSRKSSTPP